MLNIIDVGKMPPQAIEIEESVLGALLLESECIYKISHILKPECFYKDSHQKIYQAIQELVIKNKNVDILTVTDKLKQMKFLDEVGGAYYIAQLTNRVASSYHIEEHSLIIKQKYIAREFIRFSGKLQGMAFDDSIDLEQIQEFAQNGIYSIVSSTITKQAVKASSIIEKRISIFEKLSTKEIEFTGIPSGFTKLDRLTGGWQSPDLIILAARPSMGKTAVSIYCAKFPASIGVPTAYFSLEMSEAQIIDRTISYETKIDSMNLRRGRVDTSDFTKMDNMLTRYGNIPFYIDDTPALSILEFSSKAKLYKMQYGIKLIVVDYIQLMKGTQKGNRDQEIGSITGGLKQVAKSLGIPIIALAQLSRATEQRGNKRPQLSDLRESGNIEQDADMVIFLHRPEKYGEKEIETASGTMETEGLIDVVIAKYRNGTVGDVFLYTDESFMYLREEKEIQESLPELKDYGISPDRNFETKKEPPF